MCCRQIGPWDQVLPPAPQAVAASVPQPHQVCRLEATSSAAAVVEAPAASLLWGSPPGLGPGTSPCVAPPAHTCSAVHQSSITALQDLYMMNVSVGNDHWGICVLGLLQNC
jgi:hypothetical protein